MSKRVFSCLFFAAVLMISCSKISPESSTEVMEENINASENLISSELISSIPVKSSVADFLQEVEDKSGALIGEAEERELDKFLDEYDLEEYGIDIELYRITYWSKDNRGNDIQLNGDVAYINNPYKGKRYLKSVSLFHTALFTASVKADHYERSIVPLRAIHNALVVCPLYQGSGIDTGLHDIAISEQLIRARQAIDCERAALQFIKQKEDVDMMPGYRTDNISLSVGAGTALATHYLLEQDKQYSEVNKKEIHLSGTCLCEGCYSFYSILPVLLSEGDVKRYSLIATVIGSYDTWKGIKKSDGSEFYQGYEDVSAFFSEEFNKTTARSTQGQVFEGTSIIEYYRTGRLDHFKEWQYTNLDSSNILAPEMYAEDGSIDESNDKSKALIEALKQNEVSTGWFPRADICFCHSLSDDLIDYKHVFEVYQQVSSYGLNPNVKLKTLVGINHDNGNLLFALTQYLLKDNPAR